MILLKYDKVPFAVRQLRFKLKVLLIYLTYDYNKTFKMDLKLKKGKYLLCRKEAIILAMLPNTDKIEISHILNIIAVNTLL